MAEYQLAQINIAQMKAPLHHPSMKSFVDLIPETYTLAENSPGFVWRLPDEPIEPNIRLFSDTTLVNMSVWQDVEALMNYVYKSAHSAVMRDRKQWFDKMDGVHQVLWWIEAGQFPTIQEVKNRLDHLISKGESATAFTFKNPFAKPT